MARSPWNPVTNVAFAVSSVAFVLLLRVVARSDGFVPVLDHANLAFHEAGHVIFGIFGERIGLWGGTLGQLAVPALVVFELWRRRDAVGTSLTAAWFSQNLVNVARYVADARDRVLPLVGGGEHDWTLILGAWGLLAHEKEIARFVATAGWSGMLGAWGWLGMLWLRRDRSEAGRTIE